MNQLEEIEQRIRKLSPDEVAKLRAWFVAFDHVLWHQQIEADSSSGKLGSLIP
jgi:hypothetical protein